MENEIKVNKRKNVLKILLSVLILMIIFLIIYEVSIWYDGNLDSSNPLNREEVVRLLEKGKEYPNYYYYPETKGFFSDNNKTEYYIKDNIEVIYLNSEIISWVDYNIRERIMILNGKTAVVATNINENPTNAVNQHGFDYSLIVGKEPYNYSYKYLGEKVENGRTLIVVSVWNEEDKGLPKKFIIDKETGLIFKRIDYVNIAFIPIKITFDRNIKLDAITDEDVKRPDLNNYELFGNK